jgi:hypothetical protein
MIFQPSDLAVVALVLLVAVVLATILEACWTYWHWWQRRRTPQLPAPRPTPRPRLVRRHQDWDDQAPTDRTSGYGTGTSLIK